MPRGKKTCPECKAECATRSASCSCGHTFKKTKKNKPPTSFFQERRDFIKRMLNGNKSSNYKLDMMAATKVFKVFENDVNFLSKVKPPFELTDSIKYFLTKAGMDYLRKKKLEFEYKPKNHEKIVDHGLKTGEDILLQKRKTLREFLDE